MILCLSLFYCADVLYSASRDRGYQRNKPVKESRPKKIKQDQEKDEPTSPSKYGQNVDMAEQDNDYEQRNYAPGILDEIDFEPLGGAQPPLCLLYLPNLI